MAKLLFQGHASYRLETEGGVVVYVDPFAGEGYDVAADLILVTHEHPDHNQIGMVPQKATTKVYRAADMLQDGEYKTIEEYGIQVTAVPAYNKMHNVKECVGYIITLDGVKVYAAGDTSTTDFMKEMPAMELDYALLPTDGFFNMGVDEASECAKLIGAKHSIPIHMKRGAFFDQETADRFAVESKVIVKPGEVIEL